MALVWLALTATEVGRFADQMVVYMQIDGITINMPLIYILYVVAPTSALYIGDGMMAVAETYTAT